MNKNQSLTLYQAGPEAWNNWAKEMLSRKRALEEKGAWAQDINGNAKNNNTRDWLNAARADFSGHSFVQTADFIDLIFPGDAVFIGANLMRTAEFIRTSFKGRVIFDGATFENEAIFNNATIGNHANFAHTIFCSRVKFEGVTFERETNFWKTNFKGKVSFGSLFSDCTIFESDAVFASVNFDNVAAFLNTNFRGNAEFNNSTFSGMACFVGSKFYGELRFSNSTIKNIADFSRAKFKREARFIQANFVDIANFEDAKFRERSIFQDATFNHHALFKNATFMSDADFSRVVFRGVSSFAGATFHGDARFDAIRSTSAFTLAGARFRRVPEFEQAHFEEAPRLDNLEIDNSVDPQHCEQYYFFWSRDPNLPARWRSLKRLALQAHDHAREQEFFKNEVIARRFCEDKWFHGVFWVGLVYGFLSDFGRSILRPLFLLIVSILVFGALYLSAHLERSVNPQSAFSWGIQYAGSLVASQRTAPSLACIAGEGSPMSATFLISLRQTLPLPRIGSDSKLNQSYACLYGVDSREPQPPGKLVPPFQPHIPDHVAYLGFLQILVSVVLIFLLLLAIRNHFRIK